MNKKKIISFICVILLISNGVLIYLFLRRPHHGGPQKVIIEKLAFDENQIKDYKKTIINHRLSINKKDREIIELKKQLYATLTSPENQNVRDSLISILGNKQEEIEQIHFSHFLEIKSICKKNQLPKFEELTEDLSQLFNVKLHKKGE